MKCSACECPGAYQLLRGVVCWNRSCRNFHTDVIDGSDFSHDGKLVNNDLVEDVRSFLDPVDPAEADPFRVKELKECAL
jgi:hypothetical protein